VDPDGVLCIRALTCYKCTHKLTARSAEAIRESAGAGAEETELVFENAANSPPGDLIWVRSAEDFQGHSLKLGVVGDLSLHLALRHGRRALRFKILLDLCSVLECTTVCYSELQCVSMCSSSMLWFRQWATFTCYGLGFGQHCNTMQHAA